jgi:hypothetical protein
MLTRFGRAPHSSESTFPSCSASIHAGTWLSGSGYSNHYVSEQIGPEVRHALDRDSRLVILHDCVVFVLTSTSCYYSLVQVSSMEEPRLASSETDNFYKWRGRTGRREGRNGMLYYCTKDFRPCPFLHMVVNSVLLRIFLYQLNRSFKY